MATILHTRVQSKVAPTGPDDLVRLQDLDGGGGMTEQALLARLVSWGLLVVWDAGAVTWDGNTVQWR